MPQSQVLKKKKIETKYKKNPSPWSFCCSAAAVRGIVLFWSAEGPMDGCTRVRDLFLANRGIYIEHNHAVFIAVAYLLFPVMWPPSCLRNEHTFEILRRARWYKRWTSRRNGQDIFHPINFVPDVRSHLAASTFLARVIAIWLTAWTHDGDLLGVYPSYHTTWPPPMAVFTAAAGITHSLVAVV